MEQLVTNILEKSKVLVFCLNCNQWDAAKEIRVPHSNCRACGSPVTVRARHDQWARWYNAYRSFLNIPYQKSVLIRHGTPAWYVLNALHQKYA